MPLSPTPVYDNLILLLEHNFLNIELCMTDISYNIRKNESKKFKITPLNSFWLFNLYFLYITLIQEVKNVLFFLVILQNFE